MAPAMFLVQWMTKGHPQERSLILGEVSMIILVLVYFPVARRKTTVKRQRVNHSNE